MSSERDIDSAIDRAVGDIMHVEQPAGLRRRVLDRIDSPAGGLFVLPRLAAAAAVLALAVIGFVLMRPASDGQVPAQIATQPAPAAVPDSELASQSPPSAEPVSPPEDRTVTTPPARNPPPRVRRNTAPAEVPFPQPGIVAAATVADTPASAGGPIEAVPLPLVPNATPIELTAIEIAPLRIERIALASIPSTE